MEAISFLAAPILMCFILVGIHCYLGLHVLARGVIFVDLALAQTAALGTVISYLLGHEHADLFSYLFSLGCTFLAAFVLALSNRYRDRFSQEALIGILFAWSTAAVVLLIDKMNHGAEHLKHSMVGQLLWVTWDDVLKVFIIYALVGLLHFKFRKQLIACSFSGKSSLWWDFVFYGLFGVVITSSVQVAGVLLVFSFLIVPAILSSLVATSLLQRWLWGWAFGALLCTVAMASSYWLDVPSGALIVSFLTSIPFLVVLLVGPWLKKSRTATAKGH